jgi:hypothetical protein
LKRNVGDLRSGLDALLEVRELVGDANESGLIVYAEEVSDLAINLELHAEAAKLVAWAKGGRLRVDRPIPGPFLPGREATDNAIGAHVDAVDAVDTDWAERPITDLTRVLTSTLDCIDAALSST